MAWVAEGACTIRQCGSPSETKTPPHLTTAGGLRYPATPYLQRALATPSMFQACSAPAALVSCAHTHCTETLVEVNTFSANGASQTQTAPPVPGSVLPLGQQPRCELRGAGFSCRSAKARAACPRCAHWRSGSPHRPTMAQRLQWRAGGACRRPGADATAGARRGLILLVYQPGTSLALVQRCEVVLQQSVDEDVPAANLAQEDALGGIIEEPDQVPG